jgi:hypothetical protein
MTPDACNSYWQQTLPPSRLENARSLLVLPANADRVPAADNAAADWFNIRRQAQQA